MKKVLIITYYWLPSGGSGVQRWVKFTKYLRDFAWEPIIYTPENPEFPSIDESLKKDVPMDVEVLKTLIWEPYNVYRILTGKKNEPINAGFINEKSKSGWKEKISIWIRGNFLIPDPRCFWIRPSVKYLANYIQKNNIDTVITTGPPHSMHFIGLGLKKKLPSVKWIADFRDPWTKIHFYDELKLTSIANKIHHRLEKKVVQGADSVFVVSDTMKMEFELLKPKSIHVITNGYDDEDIQFATSRLDEKFTISHIGLLTENQNPKLLWRVLNKLCKTDLEFRKDLNIKLIGKVDNSIIKTIEEFNLKEHLSKIPYLSHDKAIEAQRSSQVLLLLLVNKPGTESILTGKLFEYLSAKRPIMMIGHSNGDAAKVIKSTNAGDVVDFDNEELMRKIIFDYYSLYKSKQLNCESKNIEQYSRKVLTKKLSMILDEM